MSDASILTAQIKTSLLDIARQASLLGDGLQNAAPGEKAVSPNASVQYLLTIAEELTRMAEACDDFMPPHSERR
ncbi:MAG: hypothetical protein A3E85_06155 [Gammaproteobacteria bacterium RIFCSPHIGHO2_12_FULL_45_12]|nr:MAG: hypothetical protein A3E85_06155 [Gammaproteobacteria bacterium RIFCSPHIGHO2_12_FULL_45_12]